MAIKNVFTTKNKKEVAPPTDMVNNAGGVAYRATDRHAIAQFVATGTIGDTFYASTETQLETILDLASKVDSEFLLKTAVYGRTKSFMKDMPALLVAIVATRGDAPLLLKRAFPKVINNGKMLRNFVQIVRSGKLGRSSFGSTSKKLIQGYLAGRTNTQVFEDSVGNDPTLADIIKMVHPRPKDPAREALYAYLLGKKYDYKHLPVIVKQFEKYKEGKRETVPEVPFQMLTALELTTEDWTQIARNGNWHFTRMNLNTFARHGVLRDPRMVKLIANKLRDPVAIKLAKVFPYQIMNAYLAVTGQRHSQYGSTPTVAMPTEIEDALQDAMELAIENVPQFEGKTLVFPDTSGSMSAPVTGNRGSVTSTVACIDVAALIAASVLRKNPSAIVLPFGSTAIPTKLNGRDSVMTNAKILRGVPGGGTNCSAPLAYVNAQGVKADLVIYASDNESWIDTRPQGIFGYVASSATMTEWKVFKKRNPNAKLVCIDLAPNSTLQAQEANDILNIGGFSDNVFEVISLFAQGGLDKGHWVSIIEGTAL